MFRAIMINDTHCGHKLGLTPPDWHCDQYRAWQQPAWDFFSKTLKQIGKVDALFVDGDSIDGPGYKNTQSHLTTDIGEQVTMAVQAIEQVNAKRKYIIRGTGFHTDGHTAYENFIADAYGVEAYDELRIEIHTRLFHIRHVVGRSDIPYGQQTQMQKEIINEILQGEFENYKAADVLLRAHVHYCFEVRTADSARGIMRHVYTAPALQLRGPQQSAFTRKLRTWKYDYGITLIEVDPKSKEVFIRPLLMPIKNYMRREYQCLTGKK